MKRFWDQVGIVDGGILLDGRPVRTPGRLPLVLPTPALATLVADEWRAVTGEVDPHAMPATGLANAAIERIAPDPRAFAAGLAKYGETDLLCYRAETPAPLVERQVAAWDPPLNWARQRYDVRIETTAGIVHRPQPPATITRLGEAIGAKDAWTLAALSPIVTITGSLVLGLALAEAAMTPDAVWAAARVDDDWQAEQWGEDALATATTAAHRRDFEAAARFLAAVS
ncbi:ATPase [Sphingomonas cynarae]|uniref:ATPase n=1 Tax=Sphingomonas cynarae TaxID=930197 RepID=A0ABP7D381_9SPHN